MEIAKVTRSGDPWRCIVVCPPSLILQWIDAIREQDPGWDVHVPGRLGYKYLDIKGYVIMSYYDFLHEDTRNRLASLVWDCMIVDECHRIKNRKAQMTKGIKQVSAARKVALSGSPMEKTPADLWSILNFLDAFEFPAYWGWVMSNLEVTSGYFEKYKIGKPKDAEEFGRLLEPFMLRRTKEEVAPELPERIMIEQHVAMTPQQEVLYNTIREQTDIEVKVAGKTLRITNALTMITRLMQVSSLPASLDLDAPSGKIAWFEDFRKDHEDEPTVVFTRFRATALHIANQFGCGLWIGGEKREVGSTGLLVGTIDSMGEGLNLQWAKNAVFIDSHWSTIKMTQAVDRIHRIDIKEPKNIFLLWSCREDKLVLDALSNKWSDAELVYYFLQQAAEDSDDTVRGDL